MNPWLPSEDKHQKIIYIYSKTDRVDAPIWNGVILILKCNDIEQFLIDYIKDMESKIEKLLILK